MSDLRCGWKTQLATDVERDGMGLELLNPAGDVVAEIFRFDGNKRVVVTTFNNDIPVKIFELYYCQAWERLDPFEDGSSFTSVGISRHSSDVAPLQPTRRTARRG